MCPTRQHNNSCPGLASFSDQATCPSLIPIAPPALSTSHPPAVRIEMGMWGHLSDKDEVFLGHGCSWPEMTLFPWTFIWTLGLVSTS